MSPFHNRAEFVWINYQFAEQVTDIFLNNQIDVIMGAVQEFLHKGFACVREWPVTDIMEEGRGDYQGAFIVRKPEAA
jgi:hypothetical protein